MTDVPDNAATADTEPPPVEPPVEPPVDLTTMDGVQKYVEMSAEKIGRAMFEMGGLIPTGILFARLGERGEKLDKPVPQVFPLGAGDVKAARPMMREAVKRTHATGAIMIHGIGRRVIIQMEDRELGDWIWFSTVDEHKMLGKLIGPAAFDKFDRDDGFRNLNVIFEKYMS